MKYDPEDWENYHKGVRFFNRKKFFEAHEAWEAVWKRTTDNEDKRFLQGLIQAAGSLVHVQKGNKGGAVSLHDAASEKLQSFRGGYWGVDVAGLLEGLQGVRGKVDREEAVEDFPKLSFLKKSGEAEGAERVEGKRTEETETKEETIG